MFDSIFLSWLTRLGVLIITVPYISAKLISFEDAHPTKVPYPFEPALDGCWSAETRTRDTSRPKSEQFIDELFTKCISELSFNEEERKEFLTIKHKLVPLKLMDCFDRSREILSKYCVNWSTNNYVKKFAYVLVNFCNAVWISETAIERCMQNTCEGRKIIEDRQH